MVERLFLAVPPGCLQFLIVVFPDHTHLLFFCGSFMFLFCLLFVMSLCASVYICFVVTCCERADILALNCGV